MKWIIGTLVAGVAAVALLVLPAAALAQYGYGYNNYGYSNAGYNPYGGYGYNPYGYGGYNNNASNNWYYDYYDSGRYGDYDDDDGWRSNAYNNRGLFGRGGIYNGFGYDYDE